MLQGAFGKKKIEPPYMSNLGEALEAFLDHLMPIRKGHHLSGKQGLEGCDAAFSGANGEHLVDFPGKSSEGVPVQYNMLILRQLCRGD